MGAIQGSVNSMIGSVAKIAGTLKGLNELGNLKNSGVDAKMALKARKVVQQKIKAIYANKEISGKAMTRRVGKAIDEYNKVVGGNK